MPFDILDNKTDGWFYRDCFTIDPTKGAQAWQKLATDQMDFHVGMLPINLHKALLETLQERKVLERPRK